MKRRSIWLSLGGSVAAVAFIAWVLLPAPVAVEVGTVTRGAFEQTVDEQAKTRIRDHYIIAAPLAGELERIGLREGDDVAAGDTVAVLRPALPALLDSRTELELRRRVDAAKAAQDRSAARLARSQVALAQTQIDVQRSRVLAKSNLIAAAKLESDELAVLMAQKEIESANADLDVARHDVDTAVAAVARTREGNRGSGQPDWPMKAPIAGRVLRVHQKSAGTVSVGTPLIELGQLGDLEVLVEALTNDAAQVMPGASVRLDNWGGPKPLAGRVRRIEPWGFTKISALGVEEQRVNILIDIITPRAEWTSLGEAYRLDAHIQVYQRMDAVRVPTGALFRSGDQWSVYAVDGNGRVRRRAVTIGRRGDAYAEVLTGLPVGTTVVLYPGDNLKDGVRVTPTVR